MLLADVLLLQLVAEFLAFLGLDYTASVFASEVRLSYGGAAVS